MISRSNTFIYTFIFFFFSQIAHAYDGTAIGELAKSMQKGEIKKLDTSNMAATLSDPGGNTEALVVFTDEAIYDYAAKKIYYVGGDHNGSTPQFTEFNFNNSTWSKLGNAPVGSTQYHSYGYHGFDEKRKIYYLGRSYYDFKTQSWGSPNVPPGLVQGNHSGEFSPELDKYIITGGDRSGVYLYDFDTNSYETVTEGFLNQNDNLHDVARYSPKKGMIIFGGGDVTNGLWRMNIDDKTVTRISTPGVPIDIRASLLTADPVTGEFLLFANAGNVYQYDIPNDRWNKINVNFDRLYSNLNPYRNGRDMQNVAAIPIKEYGVIALINWNFNQTELLLYKHDDGAIELPPAAQAAPASPTALVIQ